MTWLPVSNPHKAIAADLPKPVGKISQSCDGELQVEIENLLSPVVSCPIDYPIPISQP